MCFSMLVNTSTYVYIFKAWQKFFKTIYFKGKLFICHYYKGHLKVYLSVKK